MSVTDRQELTDVSERRLLPPEAESTMQLCLSFAGTLGSHP